MKTTDTRKSKIKRLLEPADVTLDGDRPWDVQVHNDGLYARVLAEGSLGLGESYMDGWWDCERLDELFCRILRADLSSKVRSWPGLFEVLRAAFVNLQTPSRAFRIGKHHYDIGNDLYERMLGKGLIYSCGFWDHASTLEAAQEAKLELICRKLGLEPGMRVLDIGCGWGGAARYLAERYYVEVVGITVSQEQVHFARQWCRGLPVEIRYQDYRSLEGTFDRIFSVGMFEHVGPKNYASFMTVVRRCLREDGLFLLHTIGVQQATLRCEPRSRVHLSEFQAALGTGDLRGRRRSIRRRGLAESGADYDQTLMHWFRNFQENWSSLCAAYDERFFRMWEYYLLSCAALPGPGKPALANCSFATRRARRISDRTAQGTASEGGA